MHQTSRFHRLTALILASSMALTPLSASSQSSLVLPNLGDASTADLSPSVERRIGESIMRDIRLREPSYLDDPEVEHYLNVLGGRIAAGAAEVGGAFRFFAIRDNGINAFAMFGGFIGINTGLLLSSQTESELAGVLAHEISHVSQRHLARQMDKERQSSLGSVLAIALALIAARSNADAIGATLVASEAASIQSQLAFTRDFEREADRVGFDLLERAGYDVHGMSQFFDRLQKASRVYENNAPVYMRTHPLTLDRLTDMENRAASSPYRQVPSSLEFFLVRAKLQAETGPADQAVVMAARLLEERKFASEPAARYGHAMALGRAGRWAEAESELMRALDAGAASAMIERLLAEARFQQGDSDGALRRLVSAMQRFPGSPALRYAYADRLFDAGQHERARVFLADMTQQYPADPRLLAALAKNYSAMGRPASQHRAQAELYVLNGQLAAAVEQLTLAQKVRGLDFYEQSAIESRLHELKAVLAEEQAKKRASADGR